MTLPFLQQPSVGGSTSGLSDDDPSTGEDSAEPVTLTSQAVVDRWGLYWLVEEDGDESAAASGGITGISGSIQTSLTAGLRNADFMQGPPDPSSPIDEGNPLPYWTLVRGTSGVDAYWVEDAAGPSGHAVRFDAHDPAAGGDEVWLEQVVPVSPYAWRTAAPVARFDGASGTLLAQHLRADGTPTGDLLDTQGSVHNLTGRVTGPLAVPGDARYLLVRVGLESGGTPSSVDLLEVYAGPPRIVHATVAYADVAVDPGSERAIPAVSANFRGSPEAATTFYLAPFGGWVEAIAVMAGTIDGGTCTYRVRDADGGLVGPSTDVSSLSPSSYSHGDYDLATNSFAPGHRLRVVATATGGFTPAGADSLVHVTYALLDTR